MAASCFRRPAENGSVGATTCCITGFCSEKDIEAAFRVQAATGAAAAAVLVQEKKITQEQALSTLTEKTIEDVCDVFLWSERNVRVRTDESGGRKSGTG